MLCMIGNVIDELAEPVAKRWLALASSMIALAFDRELSITPYT